MKVFNSRATQRLFCVVDWHINQLQRPQISLLQVIWDESTTNFIGGLLDGWMRGITLTCDSSLSPYIVAKEFGLLSMWESMCLVSHPKWHTSVLRTWQNMYMGFHFIRSSCGCAWARVCHHKKRCWLSKCFSLRPKMIVLPPGFLGPKMIVWFISRTRNLRIKVKYFRAKLSSSRSLSTPQLWRVFQSSCCFFNFKSHTYNYSIVDQRALISSKLRTRANYFGTEGVLQC